MNSPTHLHAVAYKGERLASRRLAQRSGITLDAALRATLELAAGAAGLDRLVAERLALHAAAAARSAARADARASALAIRQLRHDGPVTPWRAWFDGSAHPNPGRCGIGALLCGPAAERIEVCQGAGYGNSSEAEYLALIAVLQAALQAGARGLTVYGDSQVVINDVAAQPASRAPSLHALRERAVALMVELEDVTLRWIPRHKNPEADALSQRAVANWVGEPLTGALAT
ncbi:MAG: ribonuclease HI family protein [Pseudomonadota bacterium]